MTDAAQASQWFMSTGGLISCTYNIVVFQKEVWTVSNERRLGVQMEVQMCNKSTMCLPNHENWHWFICSSEVFYTLMALLTTNSNANPKNQHCYLAVKKCNDDVDCIDYHIDMQCTTLWVVNLASAVKSAWFMHLMAVLMAKQHCSKVDFSNLKSTMLIYMKKCSGKQLFQPPFFPQISIVCNC